MKKKIFTLLFAIVAGMTSLNAEIIEDVLIGSIYYNLSTESRTAEVTNGHKYSGNITIPASVEYESNVYSVTSIEDVAFGSCDELKSLTIPNSVTTIGKRAFTNCIVLESITLPNKLEVIEDDVLSGCSNLASITIPNSVKQINRQAFSRCKSLTSITIPGSVTSIGIYAFNECTSLTSITLSQGITEIESHAFNECTGLTSITIPNSVTSIKKYAFGKCNNLTSIIIPEGITVLEEGILWKCTKLVSVTIPSSVTEVKSAAFKECTSLAKIYNYGETPANAYSNAFDGVDKSSCALYVPKNSINSYKSAPVWKDFYSISAVEDVQAIENAEVGNVHSTKVVIDGKVYINRGNKVFTLQGQEVK